MVSSPGQTSFIPTIVILHKLPFKFRVHATFVVCRCVRQPKWFTVKSPKCHLAKSLVAWNSELFFPKFHNAKKDPKKSKVKDSSKIWAMVWYHGDCLAWLHKWRSARLLSTPTAGPFVAEQANAGQAGPLEVLAHVGQVWVFGGGSIHLSFHRLSFVFEGVSPVLFKLWSNLVECVTPGVSISSHVRPLVAVYVTHIETFWGSLCSVS